VLEVVVVVGGGGVAPGSMKVGVKKGTKSRSETMMPKSAPSSSCPLSFVAFGICNQKNKKNQTHSKKTRRRRGDKGGEWLTERERDMKSYLKIYITYPNPPK
jgi:hypothetical protein